VRTGGGTDGGVAHLMDNGIPCVVSGVPSRYIHAGCAIASLDDVENSARVAVAAVSRLTPEVVAGF
jgi:putative aminopeptidase FrvX